MNPIIKFFHELMNPHCSHCAALREEEFHIKIENSRCRSCESLERQLAIVNDLNRELLNKLTKSNEPVAQPLNEEQPKVLNRGKIPFSVVRQRLETASRAEAERIKAEAMKNAALPDANNDNANDSELDKLEDMVVNASVSRAAQTGTKQT